MLLTLSCEDFHENNGPLGGMWQLTQWCTRSHATGQIDSLVANNLYNDPTVPNKRKLYYCIHREDIQFQDATRDARYYFFASFRHTPDSLIIGTVVNKKDSLCHYSDLREFGVPASGRFHIDVLNSEKLVLSTPQDVLIFRKY